MLGGRILAALVKERILAPGARGFVESDPVFGDFGNEQGQSPFSQLKLQIETSGAIYRPASAAMA